MFFFVKPSFVVPFLQIHKMLIYSNKLHQNDYKTNSMKIKPTFMKKMENKTI